MSNRKVRITNDETTPLGLQVIDVETGVGLTGQIRSLEYHCHRNEICIAKIEFIGPKIDVIAEVDEETSAKIKEIVDGAQA